MEGLALPFGRRDGSASAHDNSSHDDSNGTLVEFRAGRVLRGEGSACIPDPRKGLVKISRGRDDGLTHFAWWERRSGPAAAANQDAQAEEDLIVFPDEAKMVKLPGAGRIVALQFGGAPDRDCLFWMQQKETLEPGGDEALLRRVNRALNGDSAVEDSPAAETAEPSPAGAGENTAAAPATTPATNAAASPNAATAGGGALGIDSTMLQSALGNAFGALGGGGAAEAPPPGPGLNDVLTADVVRPILANPQVAQRLAEFLPASHQSSPEQAIMELANSPQFRQQLASLSHAITSGQVDLAQFGLQPAPGAPPSIPGAGFSVADFLASVQAHVDSMQSQEQGQGGQEQQGDGDGDADMADEGGDK